VPFSVTNPPLCANVPAEPFQLPTHFMMPEGAVSEPVRVTWWKLWDPLPVIADVPLNTTVHWFGVNVPLLTQLRETVEDLIRAAVVRALDAEARVVTSPPGVNVVPLRMKRTFVPSHRQRAAVRREADVGIVVAVVGGQAGGCSM